MSGRTGMIVLVCGLLLILSVAAALIILGHSTAAVMVSQFGTLGWFLFMLALIVAWDSRKRWPGIGWFTRLARVLTFYRY